MKRIQLYIEPELDEELQRLARHRHVSKAQLVRDGARNLILEATPLEEDPIMSIIGIGHSGLTDVSEKHDEYLAEHKLSKAKK